MSERTPHAVGNATTFGAIVVGCISGIHISVLPQQQHPNETEPHPSLHGIHRGRRSPCRAADAFSRTRRRGPDPTSEVHRELACPDDVPPRTTRPLIAGSIETFHLIAATHRFSQLAGCLRARVRQGPPSEGGRWACKRVPFTPSRWSAWRRGSPLQGAPCGSARRGPCSVRGPRR